METFDPLFMQDGAITTHRPDQHQHHGHDVDIAHDEFFGFGQLRGDGRAKSQISGVE